MTKIGIIVHCPSPHQKALLDSLFRVPSTDVVVAYAFPATKHRNWGAPLAEGRTLMVPPFQGAWASWRLRKWLAGLDRDVWVLGSAFPYARTQSLAAALHCLKLPWAYMGEPPRPRTGLFALARDWMLRRVLRRCDGVIATGVESARRYRQIIRADRPVTSVPYYTPLGELLSLPLASCPNPSQPIRFLTLAQLIERKGLDILLQACTHLPPTGWTLDIFGEGPERQRLQRLVDQHQLPVQLNRPLPFADRINAFRGCHCFVFPSRWDGWGMALVEALAAGLPVIASEMVMSSHDFITNGTNGWITPCEPVSIATAMKKVLAEFAAVGDLSATARKSVEGVRPEQGANEIVRFCRALQERSDSPVSS